MAIQSYSDVGFGDELPAYEPDISMPMIVRFTETAHMNFGRFTDHEEARKSGLPGAIVPGIMSQGILVAMIHRWAPAAELLKIDTVFRAPVIVDSKARCAGVVTDMNDDEKIIEIDLTLVNEADETRVLGTASVRLP
jgi:acyl dehydratase